MEREATVSADQKTGMADADSLGLQLRPELSFYGRPFQYIGATDHAGTLYIRLRLEDWKDVLRAAGSDEAAYGSVCATANGVTPFLSSSGQRIVDLYIDRPVEQQQSNLRS